MPPRWNGIMLGRPSGMAGVLPAFTPRPLVVRHEGSGIDLLDLVTGIGDGVAVRGRGHRRVRDRRSGRQGISATIS